MQQDKVYSFVKGTLLDNYLKLAKVNIITGEFEFLKKAHILDEREFEGITNIYAYIKKQVYDQYVFLEYSSEYLKFANPEYVQQRVFSGERRILQSYKRKAGEGALWMTFGIVAPEGCSPEDPWVVFTWRKADPDTTIMMDALSTLSVIYYKILKINLTNDTYEAIKVEDYEKKMFTNKISKISGWWRSFADTGNVYLEDEDVYRKFTDIDEIRDHFREDKTKLSCRYRRKIGKNFRWVQMDLMPSIEYTEENEVLLLYVKDIHEEYVMEMCRRQELVDTYNRDALTLLYNRHKYHEDLEDLKKGKCARLTCLYIDVNGLHEINNHLGHKKGDDMLCTIADTLRKFFPEESLYRIGGDEFIVLSTTLSSKSMERIVTEVRRELLKDKYEISAGVGSGMRELVVDRIVGSAELAMRADKELYYKKNGGERKKRALNEELEEILTEKQYAEYFLDAIATRYAGVYFVDLDLDTLRHIYIPPYFLELLEKTDFCYSAALRLYIDKFVKWEYYDRFHKVMDSSYLTERLHQDGKIQFSYQKLDNTWVNLRILELDTKEKGKRETIWIFADEGQEII